MTRRWEGRRRAQTPAPATRSFSSAGLPFLLLLVGMAVLPAAPSRAGDLYLADAIELAFAKNPDIAVQRAQSTSLRGVAQQARAQFDWTLAASTNLSRDITPLDVATDGDPAWQQTRRTSSGYQVGVNKQLRNGMLLATSVTADALQDTTPGARPDQQNHVKLHLSVSVPLLRSRAAGIVTGQETASRLNALAAEYAVRDRVARTLHDVAVAYWTYRSRVELEQIAIDTEQRSNNLLASTRELVDKNEKPRADLVLINADHADKVIARNAAALSRLDARNSLGRILGIDAVAIGQLAPASDPVPGPRFVPAFSAARIGLLGAGALQRRPDVSAFGLQRDAAARLVAVATDNLKPQLDLQLGTSYGKVSAGGSRFGFANVPGRTQSGPSVSALLNFQFSIENNSASGVLTQALAALDQLEIRRRQLRIEVVNGVEAAVAAVISSAERSSLAKTGLASYQQAIAHEVVKQRNGISTLIDVINIESKYIDARINYLQLELEYAIAVADLRLASGTLLPEVAAGDSALERITVDVADLQGLGALVQ